LILKENIIVKGKIFASMFTHSKERVVRRGKIQCECPQVTCGGDIKKLLDVISYYIHEIHFLNEFIESK